MFRPRIALVVDQPQRDLAGMVLTAFDLCQKGATCYLVPTLKRQSEIWAIAPDFVLLFNLRRGFEQFARMLISANIQFGLLEAEGAVWDSLDSYTELLWDDQELLKEVRCVCNWGPRMSEYLIELGIFLPHQARITGCPRFDFYNPKWRDVLYEGDANEYSRRKAILLNTNAADANPRITTREGSVRYLARFGWSSARIEEFLTTQWQQVESTIKLAEDLSRDYPREKIVVRPHPFESPGPYMEHLGRLNNIEINTHGPVQPQIFKAAAVIQRSCTTAIEAALASVPTLSCGWIPTPALVEIAESVSTQCSSYAVLRGHLDAILAAQDANAGYDQSTHGNHETAIKTIRDWFYLMDGRAHSRVSDAIMDSLPGDRVVDEKLCSRRVYHLDDSRRFSWRRFSGSIRQILRLSPDWSFSRMRRMAPRYRVSPDHSFTVAQVEDLKCRIERTLSSRHKDFKAVEVKLSSGRDDYSGQTVAMSC